MSDPMLDGITLDEWHKSLPPSSPGVGSLVVTRAELLALIAAAREDERQRVTSDFAKYLRHMVDDDKGYAAGVKAARDEIDALTHGDPCDCAECRVIVMAQKMIANLMDIPARGKCSA